MKMQQLITKTHLKTLGKRKSIKKILRKRNSTARAKVEFGLHRVKVKGKGRQFV